MIEEATSSKHSGTTDAPLVSVVAPCFNAEKYLEVWGGDCFDTCQKR
ncbi:TPA: hypothetical protein ACGJ7H_006548, partial [Pseudomonas aeruginosa]